MAVFILPGIFACASPAAPNLETRQTDTHQLQTKADPELDSLADISIDSLRNRSYGSTISIESRLDPDNGSSAYNSYLVSYESDGNRVYSRLDIPTSPPPENGFPVLIFAHGWVGTQNAPAYDFGHGSDSLQARYTDTFARAGALVLTPGWRGHGTVNGVPAEGIEFMQTWDNGSYISPIFYAIDILNLVEGLQSIEQTDWKDWGLNPDKPPRADLQNIHITGHSQGGDSALTALAVSGENSMVKNAISSGSLWSGCFGTRFAQAEIYGPMASTLEAFMSGDGTWTGSATGKDGAVNPNFVFAWPPDWIGTTDASSPDWDWQADQWKTKTVAESLEAKFSEMYEAINQNVKNINHAKFKINFEPNGKAIVNHDPRLIAALNQLSAFNFQQYLTEPLFFHHSDQDYYSIPEWNADLSARINSSGGYSIDYTYPANTHSLQASHHEWFSKKGTKAGFETMLQRDINLLRKN